MQGTENRLGGDMSRKNQQQFYNTINLKLSIMKTKIIIGTLLFAFIAVNSFSQNANPQRENDGLAVARIHKNGRSINSFANKTVAEEPISAIEENNLKLSSAFSKTFPEATEVNWYKLNKDYLTKFVENDVGHCSLFSKNGVMKYDVRYGEKLSPAHQEKLEREYPEFKVTKTFHVIEGGRDIWVVNLESLNSYATARIENNELEEVQHFYKTMKGN